MTSMSSIARIFLQVGLRRRVAIRNANTDIIYYLKGRSRRALTSLAVTRNAIAVVDDDPEVRGGLELMLSSYGYRTLTFASAKEFLEAAAIAQPACLVIDIQLGESSGIELGLRLSAMGFKFPTIFMTGSQEELHRRRAMEFGCVAFLNKPFLPDELIEAVGKAIG